MGVAVPSRRRWDAGNGGLTFSRVAAIPRIPAPSSRALLTPMAAPPPSRVAAGCAVSSRRQPNPPRPLKGVPRPPTPSGGVCLFLNDLCFRLPKTKDSFQQCPVAIWCLWGDGPPFPPMAFMNVSVCRILVRKNFFVAMLEHKKKRVAVATHLVFTRHGWCRAGSYRLLSVR